MKDTPKLTLTFALTRGGKPVRKETLTRSVIKIGSDARSNIRVDEPGVARTHAVIEIESAEDITLMDLGNEDTSVNGKPVERCKLAQGDEILIGRTTLTLESVSASGDEPAIAKPAVAEVVVVAAPAKTKPSNNPFAGVNPFEGIASPFGNDSPFAPPMPPSEVPDDAPPESYTFRVVKFGPEVSASEVETTEPTTEVRILWGSNVLRLAERSATEGFIVGEGPLLPPTNPPIDNDFCMPESVLGAPSLSILMPGAKVLILPNATGTLEVHGEGKSTLEELITSKRAKPSSALEGAHEFVLPREGKLRQELPSGFVFLFTSANAGKPPPKAAFDLSAASNFGVSLLLHFAIIGPLYFFMPSMGADDDGAPDHDTIVMMQHLLNAQAPQEKPEDLAIEQPSAASGGAPGSASPGDPGKAGSVTTKNTSGRLAIAGPQDNQNPEVARLAAIQEATDFGMISLLTAQTIHDPPTSAWGRETAAGNSATSADGNMWADAMGDAPGNGALTLSGTGDGAGGHGTGIAIKGVGTIGNGTGSTGGIGKGHGILPGNYKTKDISLKPGVTTVNGHIPPEVIQRIVRQNFGRFRLCYEAGLRGNPGLSGRVAVKFVIDHDGSVMLAQDGGSDLANPDVVKCVVSAIQSLSFPIPDGGVVTVVYPITLAPGE